VNTKRELILAALFAHLRQALEPFSLVRNPALADLVDGGGKVLGLADGGIELVEEFINGPVFEWTMTPTISIVFAKGDGDDIDSRVDDVIAALSAAAADTGDLGGLVTRIEVNPADELGALDIFGSPDLKGASVPIEIDYWSDRSVG